MVKVLRNLQFQPALDGPRASLSMREQIAADLTDKYGAFGDLLEIFVQTTGEGVNKWHHYLPLYERYFAPWRHRPLRFLEIGVYKGGSLRMWRRYFGSQAVIFGVDIDPSCARFDGEAGQVRIGSQADPAFLNAVVDEMGGVDIILDDGSHHMAHIPVSLEALFPRLSSGGIYVIEDLHTAYWRVYGGGKTAQANFFNKLRTMIDDMHVWYHGRGTELAATAGGVTGIHVHDSVVVLDKAQVFRPVSSMVGSDIDVARNPDDQGKANA